MGFIAFVLFVSVITLSVLAYREHEQRLAAERHGQATAAQLHQRIAQLARYESVVDAEAYAGQLRAQAEAGFRAAEEQARAGLAQAEQAASLARSTAEAERARILAQADAGLRAAEERARNGLAQAELAASFTRSSAESDRARILAQAETEARRIAGEAYDTAKRAKELERTVRALENVIEGYGDRYLLPAFGLLDELADQYGFTEAGQKLKASTAKVTAMVKQGTAATCDYVEANRRTTAIAFVLDAFLGKVDSVLAAVKHDNYGTLQQRLRDAFQLVNHHGEAFRNARVLPAFHDAELEVLKWSVAVHQLRQRERDEQRALREQMREEERARKEYERAMKEAAKDEDVARKAMEKARRDLEQASEAQKAKYEARLLELTERLYEAEEKGKRALSMAQQTKSGNVYVISNVGSFGEDVLKIGMTRRLDPLDRVKELGDASVPFEFDVHAMIRTEDAPALERLLQRAFLEHQVNKVNPRKEFFRVPVADVRKMVETLSLQASWTMTAACREWRESLAIEEKLRNDREAARQWRELQMREQDRVAAEQGSVVEDEGEAA